MASSLVLLCGLLAMFRKQLKLKVTVSRSFNLSSENHAVPAGRRNKMLEWRLATLNTSSLIRFFLEGDVRNIFIQFRLSRPSIHTCALDWPCGLLFSGK